MELKQENEITFSGIVPTRGAYLLKLLPGNITEYEIKKYSKRLLMFLYKGATILILVMHISYFDGYEKGLSGMSIPLVLYSLHSGCYHKAVPLELQH